MPLKRKASSSVLFGRLQKLKHVSVVVLAALVLLVYFMNSDSSFGKGGKAVLSDYTYRLANYVDSALSGVDSALSWVYRLFKSRELESLQNENERLKYQLAKIQADIVELAELRTIAKFQREESDFIASGRVSRSDINSEYYSIIFPAGSENGITENCYVLDKSGYLVGKVVEVYSKSSIIEPINSPSAKTPVFLVSSKQNAVVEGEVLTHAKLGFFYLADSASFVEGEAVVTSQHGAIFPFGIPVGEVVSGSGMPSVKVSAPPLSTEYVEIYCLKSR